MDARNAISYLRAAQREINAAADQISGAEHHHILVDIHEATRHLAKARLALGAIAENEAATTARTFWTDAPVAYDYGFVTRTDEGAYRMKHADRPMARVTIPEQHVAEQVARYASGLHLAMTEDDLAYHLKNGLVEATAPRPGKGGF